MNDAMVLLLTLAVPLGTAILLALPGIRSRARETALAGTLVTLALAIYVVSRFPAEGVTAGIDWPWIAADFPGATLDIRFSLGLDGLGVWMFGLTALLLVTSVLVSWHAIRERAALFYGMLLVLECGCLGVFTARDVILFYIFFEFTLIPLFFLIGIWGSEERRYAAIKFFLYTFAGSALTFLGLLAIVVWDYEHSGMGLMRFSIPDLTASLQTQPVRPLGLQLAIFAALFAGFAVKVPLFPLHTWLPLAHVQAPTAGSVLLAGVLLKIGTYGFVRFSLAMLPEASALAMPWVMGLAVAGILYGALVALAQRDIKRLVAYSSVSHLGFCMLGLFALNPLGIQGGALQMVNHGLSTGALFALVGMLYERYHSRQIADFGGLARSLPVFSFFLLLFTFASIGLPGLNGFVGELMVLVGAFQRAWRGASEAWQGWLTAAAVAAVAGVVLGAWYMLWLAERVLFGKRREPAAGHDGAPVSDLSLREIAALAPLAVFVVWIGVQPQFFLARMEPTLTPIVRQAETAWRQQNGPRADVAAGDEEQAHRVR